MSVRIPPAVRPILCLAAIATAGRARAGEPGRYQGPEWALLDPKAELQAAAAITPASYPNCDEATVDEKTLEVYRADGTGETQDETYTKVLTEKGRRDNNVLSLGFLLPYFTVAVTHLEVIKPDGRIVPVNIAANSSESIDNRQMDENIYDPNSRILQVNVPGLEPGDVLHSVTRTTIERAIIPGQFSDEFIYEGPGYILHSSCEVRGPASRPLAHVALRDPVAGTVDYSKRPGPDGTVVYHWEINRVPRMYDEPNMPPYEMVLQRVLVSTLPDWQAVSRWYWDLSAPHLAAVSPEMRETVRRLTAGAATESDRIQAVFYYVSKNIRYMGVTPEKDRPGYEPHDVKLTFAKKYGVCRDKAGLLVEMLREAGERAYPVLINVGTRLDQDVPNPFFNHAVVAVAAADGRYILMDPTDEHTRVLLPAYDDNQSYLVCRPKGDDLMTSPVEPPTDNLMRIRTVAVLQPDGSLTATSRLAFGGVNDDAYRGAFAEMKPDDRWRFFESRLEEAVPGARLTSLRLTPANILDESSPLRAEIAFSADAMAAFGRGQALATVPWIGRRFGVVNFILGDTGLERRKYPLETEATCAIREQVSLQLPANFTAAISLPSPAAVDEAAVGYRREFRLSGRTLDGSKELALKTVEFSPKQYLGLKRILKLRDYDERKTPVFAVRGASAPEAAASPAAAEPPVESNAEILVDQQQVIATDAHTAVLRVHYVKRILSYAGKLQESEVKIPYNPSTEQARLIQASVVSEDGRRQAVSPDEINLMDAGWNASAKRYTGGKILVDSLPGVDVGSIVDVEYEITTHGKPFVSDFQSFQLVDGVDRKAFRLIVPAGLKVEERETGPAGILQKDERTVGPNRIATWQAEHVPPLPDETEVPPPWVYQAGVQFYLGDPADYLRALDRALLARAAHGARAGEVARRLAGGAPDRLAAVRAIRDYIDRTVRVAGPSFAELPLSELSDADTTLTEGYGHLADRAILFHAMLAAAGFHPEFVLASDLPPIAGLSAGPFPTPDDFQAPLVRVTVDGQAYYLNDTDQYARLGATPHDDRLGLDLADGSRLVIQAAPGCRDRVDTTYALTVGDDGGARIAIEHKLYGNAYGEENRRFSELRPEERARYYQELVSKVAQGARPAGPLTTDFGVYPGIERFAVAIDRYGIADGRVLYFDLPFTPRLIPTRTAERPLPLFLTADLQSVLRADIKLPPGYPRLAIAPPPADLTEPDGAGSVQISSTTAPDGHEIVTYRLEARPALIDPADYPAASKIESTLANEAARTILLDR